MEAHDQSKTGKKVVVKVDAELAELIPAFLKNREADILAMCESIPKGDYEIIQRIGHGMKGAGSGFGFDAISEIGKEIEAAAQNKDFEGIQKGIHELEIFLRHLEIAYE